MKNMLHRLQCCVIVVYVKTDRQQYPCTCELCQLNWQVGQDGAFVPALVPAPEPAPVTDDRSVFIRRLDRLQTLLSTVETDLVRAQ